MNENAAVGYAMMAYRVLGATPEQLQAMKTIMEEIIFLYGQEEAEKVYQIGEFQLE